MANDALQEEARELLDGAVQLRRDLHRRPEVGNDLPITRDRILEELEDLDLDVTLHESTSGIAALLTGGKPGPTVLLRGDMDALPLHEDSGVDFSSQVDDSMHACGHDTHTAMLAASAKVLSARRAASSRADPASMATWVSCPQACMAPSTSLAKSSPVCSGIGRASMSPRRRIVGPG